MVSESTTLVTVAVGGLVMGGIAGRIPQAAATELGRAGTGMIAMLVCMAVGFLCGGIGAFPVAWLLKLWIKGLGPSMGTASGSGGSEDEFRRAFRPGRGPIDPAKAPYTVIGPVIVCNKCRHSGSRGKDGHPPAECPSCGHRFTPGVKRKPVEVPALASDELVELRPAYPDRRR